MKATADQPAQPKEKNPIKESSTDQSQVDTVIEEVTIVPPEKKPNKVGVIVGVVLGLVVVGLAVLAAVWVNIYHTPARVALDASSKLFSSENVALSGIMTLESTDDDSDLESLMVFFDSASTNLPNATHVSVRGAIADEEEIDIDLGTVQMSDGVIYLQVSGVIDTLTAVGLDENSLGWLYEAIEIIDNEWWQIDVKELIGMLDLSDTERQQYENLYSCVVEVANRNIRQEVGSLYQSNDFVSLTSVPEARFSKGDTHGKTYEGTDYYQVDLDYKKLAGFVNGLASTDSARRAYDCVHDNIPGSDLSAEDFDEVTAEELEETLTHEVDAEVFLEISEWGHELKHILTRTNYSDFTVTADLNLTYGEHSVITAPQEYRPFSELVDEISESIKRFNEELQNSAKNEGGVVLI